MTDTLDIRKAIKYGRRGFRIELAAAALNISVKTLRDYESGRKPIPQDFLNELMEAGFSCLFFRLSLYMSCDDPVAVEKAVNEPYLSRLRSQTNH